MPPTSFFLILVETGKLPRELGQYHTMAADDQYKDAILPV